MITKPQVKYIQSLSQKKFRDQENAFVAEGPKIINELLACENLGLISIYGLTSWLDENKGTVSKLEKNQVFQVNENELERISFLQSPNAALAIFRKPRFAKPIFEKKITLLLDGIQDPGNLGTLIRTADWFGIENIVCGKESADAFNPKIVQSTMGSIARVQVVYEDLNSFINNHPKIPLVATTLTGKNLFEMNKINEGFILIGNESKGICNELIDLASEKISIPKIGKAESLNAAVAASIVLSHLIFGK